jgi:aspartyl-tRNA(Asn)/glutamyl-tRNA(Gln) amidotransferase subunit A
MQSLKVRRLISEDFKNLWKSNYDFLVTPTTLTTAPLLSEFTSLDNRTQCATQDYCTQPANMTGKCKLLQNFIYLVYYIQY